jgi:hypothetical protein
MMVVAAWAGLSVGFLLGALWSSSVRETETPDG